MHIHDRRSPATAGRSRIAPVAVAAALALVVAAGTFSPAGHGAEAGATADGPPPAADLRTRYERAAGWQDHEARRYVLNADVTPTWIEGTSSFWYRRQTATGERVVIYDAAARTRTDAFDHERLAARLAAAAKRRVDPDDLPLGDLAISAKPRIARFSAFGKPWRYDVGRQALVEDTSTTRDRGVLQISPDGTRALFVKDANLWVRDLSTGKETALTTDGVRYYAYAGLPDVMGMPAPRPEALWSPDSTRVFTAQLDERQVVDLPFIDLAPANGSVRPTVRSARASLPGDAHTLQHRMVVIDARTGKQVAARYPAIAATRMFESPFGSGRAWWSADGSTAYFVEVERGERTARVVAMDAATGTTRTVFEESAPHYVELGSKVHFRPALVPLPATDELVWYSERSGWAHLYLYDLRTGALKRQLTSGNWLVRDVPAVDAARREVWFTRAGVVPGRHPYYRELAKVNLDDGTVTVVSSSDADHRVHSIHENGSMMAGEDGERFSAFSPDRRYVVETVTRADGPSRTRLLNRDGTEAAVVDVADDSRRPRGSSWPEAVVLKGADGTTDIGALVFRPSDFSPARRYPVIDCVYGGAHVSHLPTSYGGALCYFDAASLAELGFVVTMIAGRGTAERDRAFHEASYGAVHTASNLEDHIAVIRQLAVRYPNLDLERVGITGFSGGGYMAAIGMLRFPDFFKVGVAASGNYDQRLFWSTWGERFQGMLDGDNYLPQAALTYAGNLKGKLMFIHGLADPGVHPAGLFQLTQALIEAGKDFDLTLQPRAGHEIGGWAQRRQWDYFVRNLAGEEPPPPVAHKSADDLANEKMRRAAE